jgi:RHS repeat-associated protein
MKKITLLLLLVLSPIAVFSQTQTENYIKSTTYLKQFKGTFNNYPSQSLGITDLIYTSSGGAGGSITISNNVLTVSFSGSWSQQAMKLGTIKALTVTPVLPKIELGPILTSGIQTGYFAKIENNNLIFYSPFFLNGVSSALSASIVGGAPGVSFSVSTGNPYSCVGGGGGGGSGTLAVSNGIVSLNFSGGWSSTCNLKTGNIVQLPSTVANTELGIIKDQNGLETTYRAKIENNWLVFYASQSVPALPSAGSLNFALNLGVTAQDRIENITYFDGLGRPKQQVANAQSFSGKDIVTPIEYDGYGRQVLDYLPYTSQSTTLDYKTTAKVDLLNYYSNPTLALTGNPNFEATTNPYSQKSFDGSPLNRVLQQAAPGNDWAMGGGHEIKLDYLANADADNLKLYGVTTGLVSASDPIFNTTLVQTSNYPKNVLYKTVTKNENWKATQTYLADNTTEEFKDKSGKVVLKRTYNLNLPFDTYYVYDDYGNLTYVLPPKAVDMINPTNLQTTITSTAVVTSGNSLSLAATTSITLTTGFNAQAGSTFTATILNNGNDNTAILNELCYQYKYDYRNRLVEKKLPGKDWEYIVYDKLDRPILTQDANLKALNKWMFTKYDAFNRPVYTGEYVNAAQTTRALVQTLANGAATLYETKQGINTINGSTVYYSNNAFPNATDINLFTINYYDDYSFDLNGGVTETAYGVTPITNIKSLATGSKVRILGTTTWTTNVIYYDAKGRPIYNYSKNDYLATTNKVKSNLDFIGKTLETTSTHARGATTTTIVDAFSYDKTGKLLSQKQKINGQPEEMIVANTYDELGQLISKGVGGKATLSRLQTVDYTYNIRGWLKGINNVTGANNAIALGTGDLFGFQINYNNSTDPLKALFNGNISQTLWKTTSVNTTANPVSNIYTYDYDALNRLTSGIDNTTNYNESLSYDKNGNIMSILRKGNTDVNATTFGTMDNLTYTYDAGNKLTKVEDSGSTEGFKNGSTAAIEYTYDANGNMKTDLNKGISAIAYNYINLPTQVVMTGGTISYVYDATGAKQQKVVNGITTDYAAGFIYENNVMKFFSQPEGYVANNSGTFDYIYQYKDHLGNVRLSYDKNLAIVEDNNYYPFGLKQKGYNNTPNYSYGNAQAEKYKYNGKELQDELGLNTYDYGARFYDPATGKWYSVDAMAEKYSELSPYNYALNNPVIYVDPDGNEVEMCCDGLKGFLVGLADNVAGTNLRSSYGGSDFNNGAKLADVVSVVGGSFLTGSGLAHTTAGASGLADSVAVTAGSGGLAIEVTAPAAALSATVMGVGALETMVGGNITMNAMSNLKNSGKETGSYTNTHESGKKYHGKGDEKRMNESAKRVGNENNDPVKSKDYTPAKNDREGFKQEARRMQTDQGGHKSPNNYNKRDSPGTKYIEQDKVKK